MRLHPGHPPGSLDPKGERTQWRKCNEITNYACAREMAVLDTRCSMLEGDEEARERKSEDARTRIEYPASSIKHTIHLDLPVRVPDFTLRLTDVDVREVSVDGKPLTRASTRTGFKSGTFFTEGNTTFVAFDPTERQTTCSVIAA